MRPMPLWTASRYEKVPNDCRLGKFCCARRPRKYLGPQPALNDDGFREWLAQRSLDPLPESSSDRITFLASLYDEVTSRLKPTVSEASGAVESIALPAAWSLNLSPKCRCRKALP
jgi:hypothetical protein